MAAHFAVISQDLTSGCGYCQPGFIHQLIHSFIHSPIQYTCIGIYSLPSPLLSDAESKEEAFKIPHFFGAYIFE